MKEQSERPSIEGGSRFAPLYERAFPSTRTGPLFNAFSYPTKISPEAIALFIAAHTKPGDSVLDVFSGSGTTGIAARLCDRPTESMLRTAAELGVDVTWGPRRAVLYEISTVGALLARVMCAPPDPDEFKEAAQKLISTVRADYAWMYAAVAPDGGKGETRHVIWSEVLACPKCDHRTTFWDAAIEFDPLAMRTRFSCESCVSDVTISDCARVTDRGVDSLTNMNHTTRRRIPVRIYGRSGSRKWQRDVTTEDLSLIDRVLQEPLPGWVPTNPIYWGDLHRSGYHQGIERFHHFYTRRNLIALSALWARVDDFPEHLRDPLRLLVLSFNASHSTLMTRVVVKKGQKDLVLTGAQSGVLYVSALPVEKNVFLGVERKVATFVDSFALTFNSKSKVEVVNGSSTRIDLPDDSIDYVFTDPPFGAFIPYAELNQVNEAWLARSTDRSEEAIISTAQGKSLVDYERLLSQVFGEVARVLKPSGLATVVFHSSKADVWKAVASAFEASNLGVVETSVLDKVQVSFKQVVSSASSRGDALILLAPRTQHFLGRETDRDINDTISVLVRQAKETGNLSELEPERLFSRYVGWCLEQNRDVQIGAGEFYRMIAAQRGHEAPSAHPEMDRELRKRLGQYFTGRRLAAVLAHLADSARMESIVDPMAGSGDMLIAAVEAGANPRRIAAIEVEPQAFDLCEQRLQAIGEGRLRKQLMLSNAFDPAVAEQLELGAWDLVITNPPYVRYQRSARRARGVVDLPSAAEIRAGLIESLQRHSPLTDYLKDLIGFAESYSGLADLAVPSWLLCAALVKEGGTLAMVVPDTWLSRDYAWPINQLLTQHFDTKCVVEDGDVSWFDDAQVRTTLLVARRRGIDEVSAQSKGHLRARLGRAAATESSLVGNLFPSEVQPERAFAALMTGLGKERSSTNVAGLAAEWVDEPRPSRERANNHQSSDRQPVGPVVPHELKRVLGKSDQLVTLEDLGWRVGQGLRTGANTFFYVELLEARDGIGIVRVDERLSRDVVEVPLHLLRPVVRKQEDVDGLTMTRVRGHVLCLQEVVAPEDLKAFPKKFRSAAWADRTELLPAKFARFLAKASMVNIGTADDPRFLPDLSAVRTNIRHYDPRRPDRRPRFWYQLPPFADRHAPDLFVARVNYRHPQTIHNPGRSLLVDANFSTLWAASPDAIHPMAMIALLSSTWSAAAMETSGTVLGGGALKLEATQLRRLPLPNPTVVIEALRQLGHRLTKNPSDDVRLEIDALIADLLTREAASAVGQVARHALEARSR